MNLEINTLQKEKEELATALENAKTNSATNKWVYSRE